MVENQLVVFCLGDEEYGIDISYAKEIIRVPKFVKVPNVPDFVEGIFNLRGTVITVIDLSKRFLGIQTAPGEDRRLLILEFEDSKLGIIVDDVTDVMSKQKLSVQNLDRQLEISCKNSIDGIACIDQHLIMLLNPRKLKEDVFNYCPREEVEL